MGNEYTKMDVSDTQIQITISSEKQTMVKTVPGFTDNPFGNISDKKQSRLYLVNNQYFGCLRLQPVR